MGRAWRTRINMAASRWMLRRTALCIRTNGKCCCGIHSTSPCRLSVDHRRDAEDTEQSYHTMKIDKLLKRYRIEHGKHFNLKDHDPADTHRLESELKPQAKELLADGVKELSRLQDILAAQDRWGSLLIFQAMDAAGQDATIKHVMSGVNPQGVDVWSFTAPSTEEL